MGEEGREEERKEVREEGREEGREGGRESSRRTEGHEDSLTSLVILIRMVAASEYLP